MVKDQLLSSGKREVHSQIGKIYLLIFCLFPACKTLTSFYILHQFLLHFVYTKINNISTVVPTEGGFGRVERLFSIDLWFSFCFVLFAEMFLILGYLGVS